MCLCFWFGAVAGAVVGHQAGDPDAVKGAVAGAAHARRREAAALLEVRVNRLARNVPFVADPGVSLTAQRHDPRLDLGCRFLGRLDCTSERT